MDTSDPKDGEGKKKPGRPTVPKSATDLLKNEVQRLDPLRDVRGVLAQFQATPGLEQAVREVREHQRIGQVFARSVLETGTFSDVFAAQQAMLTTRLTERFASLTSNPFSVLAERLEKQVRAFDVIARIPETFNQRLADVAQTFAAVPTATELLQSRVADALKSFENRRNPLADLATDRLFENVSAQLRRFEVAQKANQSTPVDAVSPAQVTATAQAVQVIVAEAANEPTLQGALAQILKAIHGNRDPLSQRVLWFVLVPLVFWLLSTLINPISDYYIKGALSGSAQGDTKKVKERAEQVVGNLNVLSEYRFVHAKVLSVRLNPKAKSPVVGQLRFGQAVIILERQGAFTQVVWTSADGTAQVRGWVFSRHLRKFT